MSEHFISRQDAESDLLSAAAYLAERIKSIDGRAEAMTAVIPLYLQKENVDLAAELSNTVDDPYTRDRLLILVAEKCAEMADDEYAMQLADAVEDHGLRGQGFEHVALRQAARGDFDLAREMSDKMDHPDGVLAGIAVSQAAKGLEDEAGETIEEIGFPGAAVSALHELASECLHRGETGKASSILSARSKKLRTSNRPKKRHGHIAISATGLSKLTGKIKRSKPSIKRSQPRSRSTACIATDFWRLRRSVSFTRAVSILPTALSISSWTRRRSRRVFWATRESYGGKMNEMRRSSRLKKLSRYSSRSTNAKRATAGAAFKLFTQIAAQFAGFEKGERAIEIAEKIKDETERIAALSQIAAVLTIRREEEQARHAFRAIDADGDRVFALIGMSDAKQRNDDREGAIALLTEAAELADTVPQFTFRASGYSEIGRRLMAFGETSRAAEAFGKSLDTITQIRDSSSQATSLAALAQITNETGFVFDESFSPVLQTLAARAGM